IGPTGELISPNRAYIRYRIILTTEDETKTPKLIEVVLHDIQKPAYEKFRFARPDVLDSNRAWDAVLENAFDVNVTSEINGADILEFKLPFHDLKRESIENEKQIHIVDDVYRIRTITDEKSQGGNIITQV